MDVDKIAQLLTGAVSLIAIIVTLITASTAAKTSALASLNLVVDTLKKELMARWQIGTDSSGNPIYTDYFYYDLRPA